MVYIISTIITIIIFSGIPAYICDRMYVKKRIKKYGKKA